MADILINGDDKAVEVLAIDPFGNRHILKIGVQQRLPNSSSGDYTFIITAKDGFKLLRVFFIDGEGFPTEPKIIDNRVEFTISLIQVSLFELLIESEGSIPVRDVIGFNHLYLVDKEILKSIASERFITDTGSTTDLGTYIINVLGLPFKLDDTLKGLENNISLGYVTTNTKAVELIKDELVLDLGTIFVPNKYNNSYDYMNTVTRLHLPFTNTIDLDVNYVVGYEINVKYIIDLYYGDMTINISSSKIDNIIHSEIAKIGRDIPFISKYSNEAVNSISTKNGVNNGILSPFIEVIRNIPNTLNRFNNLVDVENTLINEKGFITVNEIDLRTSATSNEKNNIIQLLKNGVYIK